MLCSHVVIIQSTSKVTTFVTHICSFVALVSVTVTVGLGSSFYTVNEGTRLPIKIHKQGDSPVTVNISTVDNTAVFMRDYSLPTPTITLTAAEIEKTIEVDILNDDDYEGTENFTVTIQTTQPNAITSQSQATVVINDLTGSLNSYIIITSLKVF